MVYKFMKSKAIIFLLGGLLCAACGYELPKTTETANNSTNSTVSVNQITTNQSNNAINGEAANKNVAANSKTGSGDAKLILSNSGESSSYPCNGGEVEVDESVTASRYTLTGECKKLTVDGVSVTVNVEKVGEIVVTGVSNKVIYGEGIGGKKPKITKSGTSVFVETKAEAEKKKAETK